MSRAGENRIRVVFMTAALIMMMCSVAFAGEAGNPSLAKALSRVKIFTDLTPTEKDTLKLAATLRHMKAGETLTKKGAILDKMFIVLDGQAEVKVSGRLITTLSGQFIAGETEYLDNLPVFADVVLLREADVLELNYSGLTALMAKQPRIGYVLMREIAKIEGKRLRDTTVIAGQQKGPLDRR